MVLVAKNLEEETLRLIGINFPFIRRNNDNDLFEMFKNDLKNMHLLPAPLLIYYGNGLLIDYHSNTNYVGRQAKKIVKKLKRENNHIYFKDLHKGSMYFIDKSLEFEIQGELQFPYSPDSAFPTVDYKNLFKSAFECKIYIPCKEVEIASSREYQKYYKKISSILPEIVLLDELRR